MTLATSQSNFRNHLKEYMDHVIKETDPVYIVRGEDTAVLQNQTVYNLLVDYANAKEGSIDQAIYYDKLIEAGVVQDADRKTYTRETLHEFFEEILADETAGV